MTRRERQYKDSAQLTAWATIGIIAIMIVLVMTDGSHKDVGEAVPAEPADTNPAHGPVSNYEVGDTPGGEDTDPTSYTDEEVMWIGGDGDTIWE